MVWALLVIALVSCFLSEVFTYQLAQRRSVKWNIDQNFIRQFMANAIISFGEQEQTTIGANL